MDIDPGIPTFNKDSHIKTFVINSMDKHNVNRIFKDIKFDIIVDDGRHTRK